MFAIHNIQILPEKVYWKILIEIADLAKRENKFREAASYYEHVNRTQPYAAKGWLEYAKMMEVSPLSLFPSSSFLSFSRLCSSYSTLPLFCYLLVFPSISSTAFFSTSFGPLPPLPGVRRSRGVLTNPHGRPLLLSSE